MSALDRDGVTALLATREPGEELDLRGRDLRGAVLDGLVLDRVTFGRGREERNPALLDGVSLRECVLSDCSLTRVDVRGADFRRASLTDCDLRYAGFSGTTFEDAVLEGCDLYRASFGPGTVLRPARLTRVSLRHAMLAEATGLRREHLDRPGTPALVQEDLAAYSDFLERTAQDRPDAVTEGLKGRLVEAAEIYRHLSSAWSAQGLHGDSAWAYVRSKRLERRAASPLEPHTRTSVPRWLGLGTAELLCGYGESLGRTLASIAALGLVPGAAYWAAGAVRDGADTAGLGDSLLFSLGQMTAAAPERLQATGTAVEWATTGQTFAGIALLGLTGFVLGNKIRGG